MPAHRGEPCFFLNSMPSELRLMVYEHLLVRPYPITSNTSTKQPLPLGILSVNRQIHNEAAAVFYGKNMLRIEPARDGEKTGESGKGFIAPRYRPLVRSLSLEILHCPSNPALGWEQKDTHTDGATPGKHAVNEAIENHGTHLLCTTLLKVNSPLTPTTQSHPSRASSRTRPTSQHSP